MIKVTKTSLWRSEPTVASDYDMVRVQLDMSIYEWRQLKKILNNEGYHRAIARGYYETFFNFEDIANEE